MESFGGIWRFLFTFGSLRKLVSIETLGFDDCSQDAFESRLHIDGFFQHPDELAQIFSHVIRPLLRTDFIEVRGFFFPLNFAFDIRAKIAKL